ncbi:MAG: hypothetical protein IT452_15635 [Planctomycetia bacterium]|nr:hypothetical protein [Planctomycetia bacterium]
MRAEKLRADFVPRAGLERKLLAVPQAELDRWAHEIAVLARRYGMKFYPAPGRARPIHVTARPWLLTAPQRALLQRTFLALDRATRALPALAHADREAGLLLPLDPRERRWMRSALGPPFTRPQTLLGRVDCALDLGSPGWRDSLVVLETNMVGVGASYYSWCASRIVHEVVGPWLARAFPGRRFAPDDDVLDLIHGQVRDHAAAIGVEPRCVCLLEEACDSGPAEFVRMAEILRTRGHDVIVADPGEIRVTRGRMYAGDKPVDLLYRDPTAVNLLEMGDEGKDLAGVKWAFRENRVVSGLAGEFDQKGALEIFTSLRWRRAFPAADAAIFRKHVAWTRVVRGVKTDGPDGRLVDLPEFVRRERERLVLKPNRDYGGHGIHFGREMSAASWDRLLNRAVAEAPAWVVQTLASPVEEIYPTGHPASPWEKRVTIGGFTATPRGVAMLARLSKSRIVNITRDGGVAGVISVR